MIIIYTLLLLALLGTLAHYIKLPCAESLQQKIGQRNHA